MIAVVTDSSVGYSTEEISSRGIVSIVPLNYQLGPNFFEEYASDRNGQYMEMMERWDPCKTAQPKLNNFIKTFTALVGRGYDVICIVLSGALSGTYSSAQFAARQVGGNIRVIDSETIGPGMHLLVDEAVNMAQAGLAFDEVAAHLETIKKHIGIVFSVESTDRIVFGGRLNNSKAKTTLNLRPVFEMKKKILFKENTRSNRERLDEMVALVPQTARRLIIARCGKETDVSEFTKMLGKRCPSVYLHQRAVGPVLSIHVGEGAFGVAYVDHK